MTPDLVEVFWDDAATTDGWEEFPKKTEAQVAHTIGWLVFEDDNYYIIANTIDQHHCNGRIQIPKGMVIDFYKVVI